MPTSRTQISPVPSTSAPRRRRFAAVLVSGALLGGGIVAMPQGASALPPGGVKNQSNGAKVTIGASSVKAGGRLKVTGSNWKSKGSRVQSGAKVTVKLDDGIIIGVFPIKSKKFSGYVTIPKQVKAGSHWLRFLASEPATSIKSKSFKVTK
ncbi:MAG: hypothetical protein Q7T55_14610 [Solirubrobacteraceae bacterium]|nr:hypothetical protein [Solirubrobacteraceae bacterium]